MSYTEGVPYQDRKLSIEMVPSPLWGLSLASLMPKPQWDTLRRSVYREYSYHCGICGASNTTMICHEIWDYDDKAHAQTLTGFIALCSLCNHVKHLGLAGVLARQGKLDMSEVVRHYCEVNGIEDPTEFFLDKAEADADHRDRSEFEWTSSLGTFAHLLPDFQEQVKAKKRQQPVVQPTLDM